MSVRTKDDIAEQVGDALDILEETDWTNVRDVLSNMPKLGGILRVLHEELMVGRVEREKSRRNKAKRAAMRVQGQQTLWGDE